MKTLEEFIQRLQDDTAFEKQAQTFATGDALMAFVKREGYDFTLDQLTQEFTYQAQSPTQAGGLNPAPTSARGSIPPRPDDAAFAINPQDLPNADKGTALHKRGSNDFSLEQPGEGLQKTKGETAPQEPPEKSPGELSRAGGGRHRGFSPERLKSILEEEA